MMKNHEKMEKDPNVRQLAALAAKIQEVPYLMRDSS